VPQPCRVRRGRSGWLLQAGGVELFVVRPGYPAAADCFKISVEKMSNFFFVSDDTKDLGRQYPVRKYQNRNLRDLDFPHIQEAPSECLQNGSRVPSLLPYFTKTSRYCTTAVLEESVIDNERLKQTTFLKAFDPRFVEELLSVDGCTRAIVYLPDMEIARQGEKADSLVVVVKGEVELFIDGKQHRRLTEGDYFGEWEFLGAGSERAATATAVTFCDVRFMYRQALLRTLDRCPAMKEELSYVQSMWQRRSERDALRVTKVFTERCVNCLDPPGDAEDLSSSVRLTPRRSTRFEGLAGSTDSSRRQTWNRSGRAGTEAESSRKQSEGASGVAANIPMRKIGHAPAAVGRAIGGSTSN